MWFVNLLFNSVTNVSSCTFCCHRQKTVPRQEHSKPKPSRDRHASKQHKTNGFLPPAGFEPWTPVSEKWSEISVGYISRGSPIKTSNPSSATEYIVLILELPLTNTLCYTAIVHHATNDEKKSKITFLSRLKFHFKVDYNKTTWSLFSVVSTSWTSSQELTIEDNIFTETIQWKIKSINTG